MPRSVKHGGKKVTRPSKNKKNASTAKKKALKRRKLAAKCASKTILKEWAKDKTLKQNLESMGLVYDANKAIPIRSGMDNASGDGEEMEVEEANARGSVKEQKDRLLKMKYGGPSVDGVKAARVIRALEREARMEEKRMSKGRRYRLLQQDIDFCVYMMQRHGEDYESMARDAKNLYQDTPKQIQRKIRIFKQSAEYQNLMASSSS
uniref:Nucleolar protein 16 n=1 Tax=Parascaris univalens TaxID=6257 RepID=A0A915CKB1_PARUN